MTEHHVEVVRLSKIEKHPNADTLSIAKVAGDYPVLFKTGEFKQGDLAVYVPVDSIVPDSEEWAWLAPAGASLRDKDRRIKAKRLRGIFSMGLLTKAPTGATPGQDVAQALGITRYDPEADIEHAPPRPRNRRPKGFWRTIRWALWSIWAYFFVKDLTRPLKPPRLKYLPGVYDIEPFRKYGQHWFEPGELVVVTEKIHGQNASFVHDGKQLHVKSRTRWRRNDPTEAQNTWAQIAKKYDLAGRLAAMPGLILFGETYGNNSDMPYGVDRQTQGDNFVAFDAFDSNTGRWLDYGRFLEVCKMLEVPTVPELMRLTWGSTSSYPFLLPLAEGKTLLGGEHIREGFVVKPMFERQINGGQRVILKMAGESYLTRKTA